MSSHFEQLSETEQQAVNWLVELKHGDAVRMGSKLAMSDPETFKENARKSEAELLLEGKSDIANIFANPPARQALEEMYGITKRKLVDQFAPKTPAAPKRRWF
jgi:hypothetical protein